MELKSGVKVAASIAITGGLLACVALGSGKAKWYTLPNKDGEIVITSREVEAPEAANPNNVITSEQWAEFYPDIAASFEANGDNNYRISYLDEDPYLTNVYEGYGFAIDYTSAIAHNYCLEDVANTERPHALANCLTCKTADFTALVNNMGKDAYKLSFDEVYPNMTENVGCYTCHENQVGTGKDNLVLTHDYTIEALQDDMDNGSIQPATLVCGQCHIEYYFDPETKATSVAYSDVAGMGPEAILAYYDSIGFADWTQESTGAKLLKAQHPEMETTLGEGNKHAALGLSCADCHMEKVISDDGLAYTSHKLVSPLESEYLLNTCAKCHGDTNMAAKVANIQETVVAREKEVGQNLSDFNDKLTDAVSSGNYTEAELDELRDLYRKAQWYWDFDYVENSEGAHNSELANKCLDLAQEYIDQANKLFK